MARFLGVVAAASAALAAAALAPGAASAAELKCKNVMDIGLAHGSVTAITTERLNDTATACKIMVKSKPESGVELRIEVWVPVGSAWNTHFRQIPGVGGDPQGVLIANARAGFAGAAVQRVKGEGPTAPADKDATEIARTLIAALKGMPPAPEPPPPPPPAPPKPKPPPRTHRPAHH